MLRQALIGRLRGVVESTSLSWVDFEHGSFGVRDNSAQAHVRALTGGPPVESAAYRIVYRPLADLCSLTMFPSKTTGGKVQFRARPGISDGMAESTKYCDPLEDLLLSHITAWVREVEREVDAYADMREVEGAVAELQAAAEAELLAYEERVGAKVPEDRIPFEELEAVLGRIGDLERDLQARVAQQGLDDAARDKKLADLESEVEKLRFSVAVYTRRGLAMTLLRLVLKFGRYAGDVAALTEVAVKLLGS